MRFGDQLKLESVKTQGQYLHVSGRSQGAAGYNVLPDKYDTYTYTYIYTNICIVMKMCMPVFTFIHTYSPT